MNKAKSEWESIQNKYPFLSVHSTQNKRSMTIQIKAKPGSKVTQIRVKNSVLECFVQAPPEDGKANQHIFKIVARTLHLNEKFLSMVSGELSKNKVIKCDLTFLKESELTKWMEELLLTLDNLAKDP